MAELLAEGLTADDLVTGEAIALEVPPAGLGARLGSGLIDLLASLFLFFLATTVLAIATTNLDETFVAVAAILALVLSLVGFPMTLETLTRGRSLGKLALGLRTVRDDGGPITAHHALVRALVGFVEIFAFQGVPAFVTAMVNRKGKRLGDFAAGTYVVRDRAHLLMPPRILMPPPLAAWAAQADIRSLPVALALAVRQYLARSHEITDSARSMLGPQLARRVSEYVAPPPPTGTPPEAFLAAVIATRRDRDLARLQREEALRQRLVHQSQRARH